MCLVSCYVIEEGFKENWSGRTFPLEWSEWCGFRTRFDKQPGFLPAWQAFEREGEGRETARFLPRAPKIPPSPFPFNACHTRYWGSPERRDEFGKSQSLTKPRLVWSVCRSLGKTVHTFGKFLAKPLIWYANFASSYHVIRHRSNKMIVPLHTV